MAQPTPLQNPPIIEALVDLRASVPGGLASFRAFSKQFTDQYPIVQEARRIEGSIRLEGGDVKSEVNPAMFAGVWMSSQDKTVYAQLRPDGFTLNNVKGYIGGDQLIDKALEIWTPLAEQTEISQVSRVGLHYINQLDSLPFEPGQEFTEYFTSPPTLPEGSPQLVNGFISQIAAHDLDRKAHAVVIFQLKPPPKQGASPVFKISVEVFRLEPSPVDAAALRDILDSLRELKNEIFFSLIQDKTVRYYR